MEIKTCEQYVLDQLEQARAERDWLRGKLEQAQNEAEELRGKLMERGERDASKVEQAIRKEGRSKLYRDGTGYRTSVDKGQLEEIPQQGGSGGWRQPVPVLLDRGQTGGVAR